MNPFASFAGCCALLVALAMPAAVPEPDPAAIADRDARLLADAVRSLPGQRPGTIDLYALAVAGDGTEDVFRNEAEYFVRMARQRFHARGTLALVSHPASLARRPLPLATYDNLRDALAGLGRTMDADEDILLLYLTMHGTPEHELVLHFPPLVSDALLPEDVASLLDDAGVRHRVLVVSACYSGGFLPALRGPDTLVIAAARDDRPSFGCGAASNVTWFGRAWMMEGLNRRADFAAAFADAAGRIAQWERDEGVEASEPQIASGARIATRLRAWRAQSPPGPPLAYPLPLEGPGPPP